MQLVRYVVHAGTAAVSSKTTPSGSTEPKSISTFAHDQSL